MISLILPYWDRQESANKALELIAKTYKGIDLEVVIVDDGNAVPFLVPNLDLNIKVITLPRKDEPKCPSSAWNAGAFASTGDLIVLSCIEILHEKPVLEEMADAVYDIGPKGYVLAAAWCPDEAVWHCHSTIKTPRNPEGTGIAFCGMLHRELFVESGGFDDAYRDGAGYEDNDFINRLITVGARFLIRDDLVVIHPKTGASINWGLPKFQRNEKIYYDKWPIELELPGVTFVCLNSGNYLGRGAEYVNVLFDMVRRNLSPNIQAKFACLTDDAEGLDSYIKVMKLPVDITGWWGKLYLFKDGLFPKNERVIYLDLDTLITGPLEKIAAYDGDMAMLRDFYSVNRVGPGVMLWRAGVGSEIWNEWEERGRPTNYMGDLWWINSLNDGEFAKKIDLLQDLFEDRFVSYKLHAIQGPPRNASVVCFHGLPRPHEVEGWVANVWKINGLGSSEMKVINNVNHSTIKNNIHASSLLDMPWLELKEERKEELLVVGGGPSIKLDVEEIRIRQQRGAIVMALNGAGNWLSKRNIKPDYVVVIDARDSNVGFVSTLVADHYFLASQCDMSLFRAVKDVATLFHIDIPNLGYYVPGERPIQAVGGGVTVGLIALSVAYTQGFRKMHLYGYDSSYQRDDHHAYEQKQNDGEPVLEARVGGRTFMAAPWMIMQANQFQELACQLMQLDCQISVHGTGLLPCVAWELMALSRQQ